MTEQYTKNQHYISQCLLRNFANDDNKVYEILIDTRKIYHTNYKNSMVERFTYEHPILKKNSIEKLFQNIENYIGFEIENIIKMINKHEIGECSFSELKAKINKYIYEFLISYYRSGALLTEFEYLRQNKEDKVLLMLNKITNSNYIKRLCCTISEYYNFSIIKSEEENFLISDQYLSTVALAIKNRFPNLSNRQIGMRNIMLLIPLSSSFYALFYDGKKPYYIKNDRINVLDNNQVEEINSIIINNSYKKCVCKNKNALLSAINCFNYEDPTAFFGFGKKDEVNIGAILKKEVFLHEIDKKAWELFINLKWFNFKNSKRNDICICGSGVKYKKCCMESVRICERMYSDIENTDYRNYKVNDNAYLEESLFEFYKNENHN